MFRQKPFLTAGSPLKIEHSSHEKCLKLFSFENNVKIIFQDINGNSLTDGSNGAAMTETGTSTDFTWTLTLTGKFSKNKLNYMLV